MARSITLGDLIAMRRSPQATTWEVEDPTYRQETIQNWLPWQMPDNRSINDLAQPQGVRPLPVNYSPPGSFGRGFPMRISDKGTR